MMTRSDRHRSSRGPSAIDEVLGGPGRDQVGQRRDRPLGVGPAGLQVEPGAARGGQAQHVQDALAVGLAEIEWEYRRDRQAAGIAVARRNGVYRGRAKGTTKAKPDRAKELQTKGMSAPEIGRALGVSIRTVYRYLSAGD